MRDKPEIKLLKLDCLDHTNLCIVEGMSAWAARLEWAEGSLIGMIVSDLTEQEIVKEIGASQNLRGYQRAQNALSLPDGPESEDGWNYGRTMLVRKHFLRILDMPFGFKFDG
jgi:hypothetical protein